jgi:hypothetical protein
MARTGRTETSTSTRLLGSNQETFRSNILQLHNHLHKAESAMLVQLWTGRTGLRHFLNKAQVPGYKSEQCNFGIGPETPRHVLLHCPREEERRIVLREARWPFVVCSPIGYSQGSPIGEQVDDPFKEDPPVSVSEPTTL